MTCLCSTLVLQGRMTHTKIHHYHHHRLMNASRESEQCMGVPEALHSRKLSSWSPHPTALVNSLITFWDILGPSGHFWPVTPPTTRLPPPTRFLLPSAWSRVWDEDDGDKRLGEPAASKAAARIQICSGLPWAPPLLWPSEHHWHWAVGDLGTAFCPQTLPRISWGASGLSPNLQG